MKFHERICGGKPIRIFNWSEVMRDCIYKSSIAIGFVDTLNNTSENSGWVKRGGSVSLRSLSNFGDSLVEKLDTLIETIERAGNRGMVRGYQPIRPGNVVHLAAYVAEPRSYVRFEPYIVTDATIPAFVAWYRGYAGR